MGRISWESLYIGNFLCKLPDLLQTFQIYYIILQIITNHFPAAKLSHSYCDNVTKRDKIIGHLSKLSDLSLSVLTDVRCFDRCPIFWQISNVLTDVQCFDRSVKTDRISRWSPIWPGPWCPNLSRLTFLSQFWQFAQSNNILFHLRKKFIPPFPPPHTVLSGVFVQNSPLTLYSQKTRVPGWRECVGVIIPSPCTLNRTFTGT